MQQFIISSFLIIGFTSCKKNYVCECSGGKNPAYAYQIHDTKNKAEKSCGAIPAITVYDPERKCKIK